MPQHKTRKQLRQDLQASASKLSDPKALAAAVFALTPEQREEWHEEIDRLHREGYLTVGEPPVDDAADPELESASPDAHYEPGKWYISHMRTVIADGKTGAPIAFESEDAAHDRAIEMGLDAYTTFTPRDSHDEP